MEPNMQPSVSRQANQATWPAKRQEGNITSIEPAVLETLIVFPTYYVISPVMTLLSDLVLSSEGKCYRRSCNNSSQRDPLTPTTLLRHSNLLGMHALFCKYTPTRIQRVGTPGYRKCPLGHPLNVCILGSTYLLLLSMERL